MPPSTARAEGGSKADKKKRNRQTKLTDFMTTENEKRIRTEPKLTETDDGTMREEKGDREGIGYM